MNISAHMLLTVAAIVAAPGVAAAQTPGPNHPHDQAAPVPAQDPKSHGPDGDGACQCCCCRAMMRRHAPAAPAAPSAAPHQQHPSGQDRTDGQGE